MPLLRYFLFVGGALIALLFVANAAIPTMPLPENLTSGSGLPAIRIHSDRKLPERVVLDTSVAASAQAPATRVAIAQPVIAPASVKPAVAEVSAMARVREAFAASYFFAANCPSVDNAEQASDGAKVPMTTTFL